MHARNLRAGEKHGDIEILEILEILESREFAAGTWWLKFSHPVRGEWSEYIAARGYVSFHGDRVFVEGSLPEVRVGDAVTVHSHSDSCPGVVVSVAKSGKSFKFRSVKHGENTIGDGVPGVDAKGLLDQPIGEEQEAYWSRSKRSTDRFKTRGGKRSVGVGYARYYRDPHF